MPESYLVGEMDKILFSLHSNQTSRYWDTQGDRAILSSLLRHLTVRKGRITSPIVTHAMRNQSFLLYPQ